jgi:electron transfer flavoprotein beta subunit
MRTAEARLAEVVCVGHWADYREEQRRDAAPGRGRAHARKGAGGHEDRDQTPHRSTLTACSTDAKPRAPDRVTRGMKIAVCVKAVPDAAAGRRLDPTTKRLDRSVELAISDFDTYAVEEALKLKEAAGDGEVVVVSMGPERAMDALRKALAMGADRAVLITDSSLEGADLLGTARALAGALEKEAADLVLFGQQSADGGGAVLWAAVAERLRRPVISQVSELTAEGGSVTGKRQTEFGYDSIRAPLPAVVAVSDAINTPRYPSLKGIMGAKKKPQDTLSAGDVGGAAESGTTVIELSPPPPRGEARKIEDDGTAAEKIVEFLAEKRLV